MATNEVPPVVVTPASVPAAVPTDERKLAAYQRYRNAETEGTLSNVGHPNALSDDFVAFVEQFRERDLLSINVDHLGADVPFVDAMFYRALLATTFHTHWTQRDPPARGPASKQIVQVQYGGGGGYRIVHDGLADDTETFTLTSPLVRLTDHSVTLEQGVVRITFGLAAERVNGVRVWSYELDVLDRNRLRFYLVPFVLPPVASA